MAGVSLLALIDDIATLLDDIGVLTKAAASKTMGVLGDDLALNAEQVSGMRANRELPVVWAVAKGSALNKLILVPVALALSVFLPWLVTPLLMLGGGYLCFEGVEKVLHALLHREPALDPERPALTPGPRTERLKAAAQSEADLKAFEKERIRGAIRTDFILSGEIVVITLGTVADAPFFTRAAVVSIMAFALTVGVYVLVAGIVKVDDAGAHLVRQARGGAAQLGAFLLWLSPRLLRFLSFAGTVAMFLVGGGILVHGAPFLHQLVHGAAHAAEALPHLGTLAGSVIAMALNALVGAVAGALVVGAVHLTQALRPTAAGG